MKLLLSLSLSGGIAVLILLALRRIVQNSVSKRWQYYAWLIVFARLLLPITFPDSPVGHLFAEQALTPVFQAQSVKPEGREQPTMPTDSAELPQPPPLAAVSAPAPISLPVILFALWGLAALLLFTRKATQYQSFTRYLRAGSEPVSDPALLDRYAEACELAKTPQPPKLLVIPLVTTPMLLGIGKPHIVLPAHIGDSELEKILLHELLHHKRHDALYKWFAQTVLCLHWFNPMVWLAVKALERDCELACDEAVLELLPTEAHRGYGDALLYTARTKGGYHTDIAQLALGEDAKQLKERLGIIMNYRKRTRREKTLAVCLTLALCVGLVAIGAYATNTPRSALSAT